jgi:hypothetical protein
MATSWFFGSNHLLDDEEPACVLRHARAPDDVRSIVPAARSFAELGRDASTEVRVREMRELYRPENSALDEERAAWREVAQATAERRFRGRD